MATWHQRRARKRNKIRLDDPLRWNVVTDPPNEMASTMQFPTEADASAYVYRLKGVGRDAHTFILPPSRK